MASPIGSTPGSADASQSWTTWMAPAGRPSRTSGHGPPGWRCQCQVSSRIPPLGRPAAAVRTLAEARSGTALHGRNSSATRMWRSAARSHRSAKPATALPPSANAASSVTATIWCAPSSPAMSRVKSPSRSIPSGAAQPVAASTTRTSSPRSRTARLNTRGSGSRFMTCRLQADTPPKPCRAAASSVDRIAAASALNGSGRSVARQIPRSAGSVTASGAAPAGRVPRGGGRRSSSALR